jgi:ubiquinone/menaquinone biosynthesis C-methylase UbiE
MERGYQYNLSRMHKCSLYNREGRERKAKTITAVLREFFHGNLSKLSLLDVGASTGIVANYLSAYFGKVTGVDIDREAIEFAKQSFQKSNLDFILGDAMNLSFQDEEFDVVICTHIYEHVADAGKLMAEIHRVLKVRGVCYFAAGNRLNIKESHYKLPFLSVIPRPFAHLYMRLTGKGKFYYEKHLSYWGLKKLVSKFKLNEYTKKIIESPELFDAEYIIKSGTAKGVLAKTVVNYAYWLCPSYIWLLEKN